MKAIAGQDYLDLFPNFNLVSRENDIERISSILCRKQNNSLLISGLSGVGISSILLGLQSIKSSTNTSFDILSKQFFWLDIDNLFASGDSQQINTEFQTIIRSLEKTPNAVLVISDAYNFIEGARNTGNSHFINTINNADKSNTFQVIMEVHDEQLNSVYKWNNSIHSFYTLYDVKELTGESLLNVVREASKELSEYHGIKIDDSAINESIYLTNKYRDDFGLGNAQPTRAISLLDRALSSYKQSINKYHPSLQKLKNEISKTEDPKEKEKLIELLKNSEEDWLDIKERISKLSKAQAQGEILRIKYNEELENLQKKTKETSDKLENEEVKTFASLTSGAGFESKEIIEIKKKIKTINNELEENSKEYKELLLNVNKDLYLSKNDVTLEFSKISNISMNKLDENELELLRNLESNLLKRIFGQDEAVRHVANAIKIAKIDTIEESGPKASYLFMGPSGCGKTELCKALAQNVFGDEKSLIRFDMSEYMEKHAVAKLIGAPPGYEGFEAGGILTNTVRKNPVGIYLFDEIEKAHPDVFNIFLQILSDGRLTDNIGRTVDFSDTIIIMTSNIGQKYYLDQSLSDEEAKELANEELNNTYRSELLNRFNGRENILHFKRLSLDVIEKIVYREIEKMSVSYINKGLKIEISNETISNFCKDHYDVVRGARGLPGYIKANLRPIIVNHLLSNPNDKGTFIITYNKESKVFEVEFRNIKRRV